MHNPPQQPANRAAGADVAQNVRLALAITTMPPLAEHELLDEHDTIEAWRLQLLLDAGWRHHRAELLATRFDINLHQAIHLLELGCPQRLALKILL